MCIDYFESLERNPDLEPDLSANTTRVLGILNTEYAEAWTSKGSHWVAFAIDLPTRHQKLRVTVYDSLAPTPESTTARVAKVAERLAKTSVAEQTRTAVMRTIHKGIHEPPSPHKNTKVHKVEQANGPRQKDGSSCGVYALAYMLHVARTNEVDMRPSEIIPIDDIRHQIARSILKQRRVFGNA